MEELCCYLGTKKDKNTKKIWWSSEHPIATGRQRKWHTILGRISCLAPNSRANNIENIKDTFHKYFDNNIIIFDFDISIMTKLLTVQTLG